MSKEVPKPQEDATGRNRLAHNLVVSWLSYLVFLVSGFIMPRLISDNLGQDILGIWDFCWSFVAYLAFTGLGVGSSASRHMAKHLAEGQYTKLSSVYSTALTIQLTISMLFLLFTVVFFLKLPDWFGESIGEHIEAAQYIVLFLGASVAIEFAFDTSRGLMTGSHRWDIHNMINSISKGVSVLGMAGVLLLGGNIVDLAITYLIVVILSEILRFYLARKVCPYASFQRQLVTKDEVKTLYSFGIKSAIAHIPAWAIIQSNAIFVTQVLGPAALAVAARPIALIKHIESFINKFTFMLTPTAASMKGTKDLEEIRTFFLTTTKYNVAFTSPLVITLIVLGDSIMRVWMGENYVNSYLILALSTGFWFIISQSTVMRVLIGMNWHGSIGFANLLISFLIFGGLAGYFYVNNSFTLEMSAHLVTIPLLITTGLLTPLYACYRLGIFYPTYLLRSFARPVAINIIAMMPGVIAKIYYSDIFENNIAIFMGVYYFMLVFLYWSLLLEQYQRNKISRKLPFLRAR